MTAFPPRTRIKKVSITSVESLAPESFSDLSIAEPVGSLYGEKEAGADVHIQPEQEQKQDAPRKQRTSANTAALLGTFPC